MPESLARITDFLARLAPLELAESWDNVGLLLGEAQQPVDKVLTCLTLTEDVADEAVQGGARLIVAHHPILFRPVQRLTSATAEGAMLLKLIRAEIAVYSPHTAYDSAPSGINQQLAELLGLREIVPLRPAAECVDASMGSGRYGQLVQPRRCDQVLADVRHQLKVAQLEFVGDPARMVHQVAVACGSAGEFLKDAHQAGCELFITGETRFHTALEARQLGIGLVVAGHYATERPGIEWLAARLQREFPRVKVWASEVERNPLQWSGS
ncbi:Nif3-like dinuclear metal center hexameric protein [Planctomicrobium sp. SH664]|uniref:Nif3-like dinuclear metal center hexameric protein n=1 Tax=Planctomicrobium sp. SH664 TaxID=3448125 RepID=UPI003F5C461E